MFPEDQCAQLNALAYARIRGRTGILKPCVRGESGTPLPRLILYKHICLLWLHALCVVPPAKPGPIPVVIQYERLEVLTDASLPQCLGDLMSGGQQLPA